jgi:hypothetical protein
MSCAVAANWVGDCSFSQSWSRELVSDNRISFPRASINLCVVLAHLM